MHFNAPFLLLGSMVLLWSGSTYAGQNGAPKVNSYIEETREKATAGLSSIAQFDLANAYAFGLHGVKEDKAEAYYWASVCANMLNEVDSFHGSLKSLEEISFLQETLHPGRDTLPFLTKRLLVDSQLRIFCEDLATVIGRKLGPHEKKNVRNRVNTWAEQHKLQAPTIDKEQLRIYLLTRRLLAEIDSGRADMEGIRKLLADGADVHFQTRKTSGAANTLLLDKAVEHGRGDVAGALIDAGLNDPQAIRKAFRAALDKNDIPLVQMLLAKGAVWDAELLSAGLYGAMKANDAERTAFFVKKGATLGDDKRQLGILLGALVKNGSIEMVKRYINMGGPISGIQSYHDNATPLELAARREDTAILKLLLEKGALVADSKANSSLLRTAVVARNMPALKILLPEITLSENERNKLVISAVNNYHPLVMDYLLAQGFVLTDEQKESIAKCAPEEKTCDNGLKLYGGPPYCQPVNCPVAAKKSSFNALVEHPLNQVNAQAREVFLHGSAEEKSAMIATIQQAPGNYAPPVLHMMAETLFHKIRDEEGLFWSIAAVMRADESRFVCRAKDKNNARLWGISFSPTYEFYKRREPEKIKLILEKVRGWDVQTPHNYNPQYMSYPTQCISAERWEMVRNEARNAFISASLAALNEGNKKQKIDDLLPLAQKEDAEAQYQLGLCFLLSGRCRMSAEDTVGALAHKAAQQKAQEGQSVKTFSGLNLREKNKQRAMFWLEKSAAQGYVPAIKELAVDYAVGRGVKPDGAKAQAMAMQLFEKGEPESIPMMATITAEKQGSREAYIYAWQLFAKTVNAPWGDAVASSEAKLTDEELADGKRRAEELIKTYLPVYGSKKP